MLTAAGTWKIDLNEPHQKYRLRSGEQVPGVTTVNGVFDKFALRPWYADMERAGVLAVVQQAFLDGIEWDAEHEVEKFLAEITSRLPRTKDGKPAWFADIKKDKAADLGTVTHARCEAFVKGPHELDEDGLSPELLRGSMPGFLRFQSLWAREGLTLLHSELQMVSEKWRVGGTADIIARQPDGRLRLLDIKTSKASKFWPYKDVFSQVAAYAEMYEEFSGNRIEVISVERIGKEENDPGQSYTFTEAQRAAGVRRFLAAREAYEADKELAP